MNFLDKLLENNLISSDIHAQAKESLQKDPNASLEAVLVDLGVDLNVFLEKKAEYVGVPLLRFSGSIPEELLSYIPENSASYYKMVPLEMVSGKLEVGMVDPNDVNALNALEFIFSKVEIDFHVNLISEADFRQALESYKSLSTQVTKALTEFEEGHGTAEENLIDDLENIGSDEENQEKKEDAPVAKIVANIIRYAVDGRASDVHIEPIDRKTRVRYRVDGNLYTSLVLPGKVHDAVVARIKILSKMKLDERRKPQDGRFSTRLNNRKIDFRVSTFPTYYGEKVVFRILDSSAGVVDLDEIGFRSRDLEAIKAAIERPYGMILISGPTGSGKTTTLYSMLEKIDKDTENVLSLEDPVEYNMPGMSQSQVRPEIGYTFASGLRTTLRQDPDVIMVGEIRDSETAKLAVQAALTGHIVFATIHTNTAVGVIPRLVDMGVDPYLIAPTLILSIAQRLTKKLCEGGGRPIPIKDSYKMMVDKIFENLTEEQRNEISIPDEVYEASSTDSCPEGTKGRLAVFEVLRMNKEIEALILKGANESEIMEVARRDGMLTMKEDALIKAFERKIPFEEVNKL